MRLNIPSYMRAPPDAATMMTAAALGGAVFNRPGNFLPNDRAHRCREKTEIHHRDGDLVAVEDAMPGDDGVEESRALLILS
jgi:hypothetical protein